MTEWWFWVWWHMILWFYDIDDDALFWERMSPVSRWGRWPSHAWGCRVTNICWFWQLLVTELKKRMKPERCGGSRRVPSAACRLPSGTLGSCRWAGSILPALLCYLKMLKNSSTAAAAPSWHLLRSTRQAGETALFPPDMATGRVRTFLLKNCNFPVFSQQRRKRS